MQPSGAQGCECDAHGVLAGGALQGVPWGGADRLTVRGARGAWSTGICGGWKFS